MRYTIVIRVLIVLVAVGHLEAAAQDQRWLPYEPATVQLEGRLITESKYGPPNFGEQPKTDQKVNVPILVLLSPINVRGTPGEGHNAQSVSGVKKVQLVFLEIPYRELIGKDVLVTGELFHAFSGHHYTDVVMTVSSVEGKRKTAELNRPYVLSEDKLHPCPDALTQYDINNCAGEHYRLADKQLNEVYKRILKKLESTDRTNLIEAQRAWLKYRSSTCWAERELFHGGSIAPTVEAMCLQGVTEARTKELIRVYETDDP